MAQIVKRDATIDTLRIRFDIRKSKGALGYLECIESITNKVFPWEQFFALITSVICDGESLNSKRLKVLISNLRLKLTVLPNLLHAPENSRNIPMLVEDVRKH